MPTRVQRITRITVFGTIVNTLLLAFKFLAGILGGSAAMLADAVHSLSDFLTDIVVLVFVKISNRPADRKHSYGYGKYETLATLCIGLALLAVGIGIAVDGVEKIIQVWNGETLAQPGWIAFWAAIASIVLKELTYWLTIRVAKQVDSEALKANAWHHRSDALSSIGTGLGIGGAILLGQKWTILDPIAALVVSVFIVLTALRLTYGAISEFLEQSLPEENENEIRAIVAADTEVSELHHLCTRRLGNRVAIEMHLRMPGNTPLTVAHKHASAIEQQLKQRFGDQTHINIHLEPTKVNGKYEE
ncbi:MAG: cation diffusion facilitator family transporter [Paludibacteraceae bacterium]|nr:cation diffusion facilitator family transporter [Paludibacteraceae bacterium]